MLANDVLFVIYVRGQRLGGLGQRAVVLSGTVSAEVAGGSELDELMLIQSGQACMIVDGVKTQFIDPGQFMGSISFITDEIAPADFVALEPTRYLRWNKSSLKRYLTKNPELHAAIQSTLSIDLMEKLKTSWLQKTTS